MKDKKQLHQFDLSKLANSTDEVILDKQLSQGFNNPVVKNVTEDVGQKAQKLISGTDFVDKIASLRAAKQAGKKLMGAVPLLGAGYAALSGDPAMAADELAGDVPVIGQAYEALKPTDSGNVEEERQMIAERNSQVNYDNSPAHLARLKALQGF